MPTKEAVSYPGKLVAFEGIDRAGKTSAMKLLAGVLVNCKVPITLCSEKMSPISDLLSGENLKKTSGFLKTYLFATDRAWTYEKKCIPALQRGELVIWDRYIDSAIVYRTVEFQQMKSTMDINFVNQINGPFIQADLTFILDVSVNTSEKRAIRSGQLEPYTRDFLKQVRVEYLKRSHYPGYIVINGENSLEKIIDEIKSIIQDEFKELFYEIES
ncbi:MAG: dTMP kinase [Deferribacteres bacterium]|nr:dTMP kinase [candidate division KSB1 bacterium]MCB9503083.1 dTMP kinase [Deferribacteres bacterium]